MPARLPSERGEVYRLLIDAGWSDEKIGKAFCVSGYAISAWRRANRVLRELPRKIDPKVALAMHGTGASDGEIAKHFGVTQSGATRWRYKNGLPANYERSRAEPEIHRKAKRLLRQGSTAAQVAKEVHRSKGTIQRLRRNMTDPGLRRTGITNRVLAAQVRSDPGIMKRIEDAIGRDVPANVKEDAVADLYLALMEGRVAACRIEAEAPRFRTIAWSYHGSQFGPRSLDACNDDGFSLGDVLADPDALDQLEAAAELAYEIDD